MKKLLILFIVLMIPVAIFAQEPTQPPANWGEVIMNPQKWFVNLASLSLLVAFLTTFLSGILKIVKAWPRQFLSWAIAIILVVGSDLLNIGYAKDYPILLAAINGLAVGLSANGAYDIPWVKDLLAWIEKLFNPKVEAQKEAAEMKTAAAKR